MTAQSWPPPNARSCAGDTGVSVTLLCTLAQMTAKRAAEWIADMRETAKRARAHGGNAERFIEQADRVAKKAKAIGMTLPSHKL
jgi:truncated hemoglobin YjbI